MRSLILTAAVGVAALVTAQAALAFTYEGHGSGGQPAASAQEPSAKAGLDMDPGSLIAPMGTSVPGTTYDFGPGAFNNGLASPPSRTDSIGPGWLYSPR